MNTRIILPMLALFLAFGCENEKKRFEEEIDNFMAQQFAEPDFSFGNAFKDKNFEAFAEDIDNAVFFLKSLNFDKDTIHWKILELAVLQLEGLQEGASNGSITDLDVLRMVFFKTDQSITAYHLAIVKTYFHEVNEKKQGLERLQRALIRLDNSIQYHTYEFTEQELVNLAAIRKEIANADKPTLQLWNKVNAFFNRTGQKTKNQFSENY